MSNIFTTTVRFNLDREEDRSALEWLQSMDKKQYRSYSRAIIAAVNDHFSRRERLVADPYLETREKEDAFLLRVQQTVEQGLASVNAIGTLAGLFSGAQCAPPQIHTETSATSPVLAETEDTEEDMETALDFVDGF